jgi:hypothetical protein
VTISRQLGSLGDEIGQDAARVLGYSYVDRHIVETVSQRMEAPEEAIHEIEEKSPTFPKRVANAIIQAFADGSRLAPLAGVVPTPIMPAADDVEQDQSPPVFTFDLNDTLYLNFVRQVIKDVAERGDAVIVGRGTHLLLRDLPHSLHVHVVAPMKVRAERLMRERQCSYEAAEKAASNSDNARESYTQRFYHTRWSDPNQYDLTINTARLSREHAVNLIVSAVKRS